MSAWYHVALHHKLTHAANLVYANTLLAAYVLTIYNNKLRTNFGSVDFGQVEHQAVSERRRIQSFRRGDLWNFRRRTDGRTALSADARPAECVWERGISRTIRHADPEWR